jgi:hypothetical protein
MDNKLSSPNWLNLHLKKQKKKSKKFPISLLKNDEISPGKKKKKNHRPAPMLTPL